MLLSLATRSLALPFHTDLLWSGMLLFALVWAESWCGLLDNIVVCPKLPLVGFYTQRFGNLYVTGIGGVCQAGVSEKIAGALRYSGGRPPALGAGDPRSRCRRQGHRDPVLRGASGRLDSPR